MRNLFPPELCWLYRQVKPFLRWHAISFLCFTAGSLLALAQPLLMKWLIDVALPKRQAMLLVAGTALLFVAYEGRALCTSLAAYLTLCSTQRMALGLRMRLLKHLDTLSVEYHEGTPVGSRLYPFREPIDEIAYFGSDLFPSILRTLVATFLTFSAMLTLNAPMTFAILPFVPVFLLARHYFRRRLERDADGVQRERTLLNGFLQEHVAAVIQIQLLRRENCQERTAFRLLAKTLKSQQRLSKTSVLFTAWTSLAIAAAASAVVGYGGSNVLAGTLTIGGLVAFYSYVTQLFEPLSSAMDMYARALRTFSSIRQVQLAFSLQPAVKNRPSAVPVPITIRSVLLFQNVSFGYAKRNDFLQIPFLKIPAGQRVAVVGPNGAGKSTFAKLAARLYDVTSGSVRVGGIDVRDLELGSLRATVCHLPQTPALFDDTLVGNLRLGDRGASETELFDVIEFVGLGDLVDRLPEGWNARIGPGGSRLSGGERQRLTLARTLLQRPRILVLDEATSALDPTTEHAILLKIRRLLPEATLIFLSHRLLSLTWVDRILVFESGRIVQDGPHDVLQKQNGSYGHLFRACESSPSLFIR
jgi:ABC-type multidrug transport system fused ATPase/permease subunit